VLLVGLLALGLSDLAVSGLWLRDGVFLGRPLPPFGVFPHPKQREIAERMGEEPRGPWAFDAELGWTWRPSAASGDGLMRTNALGGRGPREYASEPPAGKRRAVVFGDSFVFCDEVAGEDTFEAQLERLEPDLECLNFGVSGYGTDQALLRFRREGRKGAELVLLGLLLENAGRNVNRYRPLWSPETGVVMTKPRFVLDPGGALELLPQPYATRAELRAALLDGTVLARVAAHEYWLERPSFPGASFSSLARLASGYLAYRARKPARLWEDTAGEPFRVTLALLAAFRREALGSGAREALVLVFGARPEVDLALDGRPYWGALFDELRRLEIPFVDLIAPLAERERAAPEDPLFGDGHLSPSGNAVVARVLQERLRP
jgi:hypothetical protein